MADVHDPGICRDPETRLAFGEENRISMIVEHRRRNGIRLPNIGVHALCQEMIENRIAMGWLQQAFE